MGVPSFLKNGHHGYQGDLEEMERTKRTNQKTENAKENRNIDQGNFGEMKGKNAPKSKKQETQRKSGNPPKIGRPGSHPTNEKLTPENSDQARGDGAWESRESELQADAH